LLYAVVRSLEEYQKKKYSVTTIRGPFSQKTAMGIFATEAGTWTFGKQRSKSTKS